MRSLIPGRPNPDIEAFVGIRGISFNEAAEDLRRKIIQNILAAITIAALALLIVTLSRVVMEGWQPLFAFLWVASGLTVGAYLFRSWLSIGQISLLLWLSWTAMAFGAFVVVGMASMGPVFFMLAVSMAAIGLRLKHVLGLVLLKFILLMGVTFLIQTGRLTPVPSTGLAFLTNPLIWVLHSILLSIASVVVVYATAVLVRFYFEIADRTRQNFYHSLGLMSLARDTETGEHIFRIEDYSEILYELLSEGTYGEDWTPDFDLEKLKKASRLHDLGKISIPDSVLQKPGGLTPEEFEIIKTHTDVGARLIEQIADKCRGVDRETLELARDIARWHHENWTGGGYPDGLSGREIPLAARIVSICDVYDALRSERPYKPAWSHQDTVDEIARMGHKFDPRILDSFMFCQQKFDGVWRRYMRVEESP
ncbi:HD-GYP domain-containing protein [Spiribacter insolitus]|uniref:HD-GYP domain-containing protein n=1 Tax=Spiribacter insolitus TaxID=3122417 RepID=A0ABV3T7N8_9GAMM